MDKSTVLIQIADIAWSDEQIPGRRYFVAARGLEVAVGKHASKDAIKKCSLLSSGLVESGRTIRFLINPGPRFNPRVRFEGVEYVLEALLMILYYSPDCPKPRLDSSSVRVAVTDGESY